jgi:hypothetical protein
MDEINENTEVMEDAISYNDIPVNIEDVMHTNYLQYSLSVNIGRAIPDVRDGLKPGNRRILYAMHKLGLTKSRGFVKSARVVQGANMTENEYGNPLFANFFFFITGFHGFQVFSGVIINFIVFYNVMLGTYERRGHYDMVEKVGLYWHFVDLVWVFVFTFFYLV